MHLFNRMVHATGSPAQYGPTALAMRELVSRKTGTEFSLWSVMIGAPVGSMSYTARVDGLAGMQGLGTALAGDDEYEALLAKMGEFSSGAPPVDSLSEPIGVELGAEGPPVGAVATVTTAVIGEGGYAAAVTWGLEVAAHGTAVTGMPIMLLMGVAGTFGQLTWIGVAADAAGADAANAKLAADAAYVAKLDEASGLFVPGLAQRTVAVRAG